MSSPASIEYGNVPSTPEITGEDSYTNPRRRGYRSVGLQTVTLLLLITGATTWGILASKGQDKKSVQQAVQPDDETDGTGGTVTDTPELECLTDRLGHFHLVTPGQGLCNDEQRFGVTLDGVLILHSNGVTSVLHQDPLVAAYQMTDHGYFQLLDAQNQVLWEAIPTIDINPTASCLRSPLLDCPYLHLRKSGDLVLNSINSSGLSDRKVRVIFPDLFLGSSTGSDGVDDDDTQSTSSPAPTMATTLEPTTAHTTPVAVPGEDGNAKTLEPTPLASLQVTDQIDISDTNNPTASPTSEPTTVPTANGSTVTNPDGGVGGGNIDETPNLICDGDRMGHFQLIAPGEGLCNDEQRFGVTTDGALILHSNGVTSVLHHPNASVAFYQMTDQGYFQLLDAQKQVLWEAAPVITITPSGFFPYLHLRKSGLLVLNSINENGLSDRKVRVIFPDLFPNSTESDAGADGHVDVGGGGEENVATPEPTESDAVEGMDDNDTSESNGGTDTATGGDGVSATPQFECQTDRLGHFRLLTPGQGLCNDEQRFGVTLDGALILHSNGVTSVLHQDPLTAAYQMTDHGHFQLLDSQNQTLWDAAPTIDINPTASCLRSPLLDCPYLHLRKSGDLVLNSINSSGWSDRKVRVVFPDLFT